MYKFIFHPISNKKYKINSNKGFSLLVNYINQLGGVEGKVGTGIDDYARTLVGIYSTRFQKKEGVTSCRITALAYYKLFQLYLVGQEDLTFIEYLDKINRGQISVSTGMEDLLQNFPLLIGIMQQKDDFLELDIKNIMSNQNSAFIIGIYVGRNGIHYLTIVRDNPLDDDAGEIRAGAGACGGDEQHDDDAHQGAGGRSGDEGVNHVFQSWNDGTNTYKVGYLEMKNLSHCQLKIYLEKIKNLESDYEKKTAKEKINESRTELFGLPDNEDLNLPLEFGEDAEIKVYYHPDTT